MRQVAEESVERSEGKYIERGDLSANKPFASKKMSKKVLFKKSSIFKKKSFLPAFKKNKYLANNSDLIEESSRHSGIKESATIEGRTADFSLDRGFSLISESGIKSEHSILGKMNLEKDSLLGRIMGAGTSSGSQDTGDSALRAAVAAARGMASTEGCEVGEVVLGVGGGLLGATGGFNSAGPGGAAIGGGIGYGAGQSFAQRLCEAGADLGDAVYDFFNGDDDEDSGTEDSGSGGEGSGSGGEGSGSGGEGSGSGGGATDPDSPMSVDPNDTSGTPNDGDGTGSTYVDPATAQKLYADLLNFSDPSSTPGPNDDFGAAYPDNLTMPDQRVLDDKCINWGDNHSGWGNFQTLKFNPQSIEDPSVNWGDYHEELGASVHSDGPVDSTVGCESDGVSKDNAFESPAVEDHF